MRRATWPSRISGMTVSMRSCKNQVQLGRKPLQACSSGYGGGNEDGICSSSSVAPSRNTPIFGRSASDIIEKDVHDKGRKRKGQNTSGVVAPRPTTAESANDAPNRSSVAEGKRSVGVIEALDSVNTILYCANHQKSIIDDVLKLKTSCPGTFGSSTIFLHTIWMSEVVPRSK